MRKISSLIRKLTIPPVFAALLLVAVYVAYPHYFSTVWQFAAGLFFLIECGNRGLVTYVRI